MKCKHIIAFHIGHGTYTKEEYKSAKDRDDLDCCGGTMLLKFCPLCGNKLKSGEIEGTMKCAFTNKGDRRSFDKLNEKK